MTALTSVLLVNDGTAAALIADLVAGIGLNHQVTDHSLILDQVVETLSTGKTG